MASATCPKTVDWCPGSRSSRTSRLARAWTTATDRSEQRLEWIFSIMPEVAAFRARRSLELSGGQQKLVALARALMAGRRILLLDEPFEGLAPALARRLGEVMSSLKREGISILIAESNVRSNVSSTTRASLPPLNVARSATRLNDEI